MNVSNLTPMAVIAGTGTLAITPLMAQEAVPAAQVRALNLARNTAVAENGGLSVYRPQPCMFKTSAGGGDCLVQNALLQGHEREPRPLDALDSTRLGI